MLLGPRDAARGALVEGRLDKPLVIDTLLPKAPERFPWAGHLGSKMVEPVVAEIEAAATTLVFTNTRSQAELWYQHILRLRPEWAGILAIHHGSLSRETRDWVEQGLKDGSLKAVVCTSSLDLGVDFLPVERVIQIGSPKGVARLLQRAGRSGHAPGRVSRITLVPTHTLELVEAAAVRDAVLRKNIESRRSLNAPLDVLAQHCVTVALGGGFRPDDLLAEVRETAAYEHLSDENWTWVLDFIRRGGPSLTAYPGFRRVAPDAKGIWRAADRYVALQPQTEHWRDRQRRLRHGSVRPGASGREARRGRGEFCCAHEGGRQILVRWPLAGIRPVARSDRLCPRRKRRRARRRDGRAAECRCRRRSPTPCSTPSCVRDTASTKSPSLPPRGR